MFIWDPKKRLLNIRKHGIDFTVASQVFEGMTLTAEDRRFQYDEQRFLTLGVINGLVVSITHTERHGMIRIISIRKATRYETNQYYAHLAD